MKSCLARNPTMIHCVILVVGIFHTFVNRGKINLILNNHHVCFWEITINLRDIGAYILPQAKCICLSMWFFMRICYHFKNQTFFSTINDTRELTTFHEWVSGQMDQEHTPNCSITVSGLLLQTSNKLSLTNCESMKSKAIQLNLLPTLSRMMIRPIQMGHIPSCRLLMSHIPLCSLKFLNSPRVL